MLNQKVASILYEIADLLELKEESFKPRAYRRAAHEIEQLQEDIETVFRRGGLREIPGVGEAIAEKVSEIIRTGQLRYLDDLKEELPEGLTQIMHVPEVGPKTTMVLYKQLGVSNMEELKLAVKQHRIRRIKGFGERSEENILRGISLVESSKGRMLLAHAYSVGMGVVERLRSDGFEHVSLAGSLRRMKETVGDIDVLVGSDEPKRVIYSFTHGPGVKEVIVEGPTKASIRIQDDTQIDLRVVADSSFGAALQYFTGSKEHNVKLRSLAIDQGYKLNEYALFKKDTDEVVASRSEDDIYRALGIQIMPPEMREDRGEIEAGIANAVPEIVEMKDLKGDLHVHTEMSDGTASMRAMAEAARAKGYEYVAITDHSESLPIANGLSVERLRDNIAEARRLSDEMYPFRVLIGSEVEIKDDGSLDYTKDVLEELDLVVGAVHSRFKMTEREMTERIITALSNENLTILAHPTGRLIGKRDSYLLDMDKVMDSARSNGVSLEVNGFPDRLDLNDVNCRKAYEKGLMVSISTDSHSINDLENMRFSVATARRGWIGRGEVLNAKSLDDLERTIGI